MAKDALEWLEEVRGLEAELAVRHGVKAAVARDGDPVLVVPYRRGGEEYGAKYRKTGGKEFRFAPKGVEHDLWNVDILRDDTLADHPVIITEGELDALSVIQAGFPRCVSIPDGWTDKLTDPGETPKSRPILANADRLRASPCVIVAGDDDPTGRSFVRAVGNLLEGHPVKFCRWPEGCKDPNDVLRRHGAGRLAECINGARAIDPDGGLITGISDLPPAPEGAVYKTGEERMDRVLCFHEGFPTIVTGIPAMGKSTLLTWALWRAQKAHNIRIGLNLYETPGPVLRDHLARMETGKPWRDLDRTWQAKLASDLDHRWRIGHKVEESETPHDMGWFKRMMWAQAVRDGCKIVVVDPWNEIDHIAAFGESTTTYVNAALAKIRQWAERYGCAICIVAHPTKMLAKPGEKPKPPFGYDISDSAAWFNKAACGVTVHRVETEDGGEVTRVFNWKTKFKQLYDMREGFVDMEFDERKMVFRRPM